MAVIHAVYDNADFGDGPAGGATASRRALVRDAVGTDVEELVHRFNEERPQPDTIEDHRRGLAQLDATGRRLEVVAIADHLEKYVDLGVLYFGDDEEIVDWTRRIGPDLIELATELGEPRLAEMVAAAFAEAEGERVPPELRASDGSRHLKLVVPRSCRSGAEALEQGGGVR
jgi:hypothetical protein